MRLDAKNVDEYLKQLPEDKKETFMHLRQTILSNLPEGFEEKLNYGMIGYVVPLQTYPEGYHASPGNPLPFVNVALQKNHIAIYHLGLYAKSDILDWFVKEYQARTGRKPDMGKSCIRFKKNTPIPFDLIGELMQKITANEWIDIYEKSRGSRRKAIR